MDNIRLFFSPLVPIIACAAAVEILLDFNYFISKRELGEDRARSLLYSLMVFVMCLLWS